MAEAPGSVLKVILKEFVSAVTDEIVLGNVELINVAVTNPDVVNPITGTLNGTGKPPPAFTPPDEIKLLNALLTEFIIKKLALRTSTKLANHLFIFESNPVCSISGASITSNLLKLIIN
jgi:hypothetical protein